MPRVGRRIRRTVHEAFNVTHTTHWNYRQEPHTAANAVRVPCPACTFPLYFPEGATQLGLPRRRICTGCRRRWFLRFLADGTVQASEQGTVAPRMFVGATVTTPAAPIAPQAVVAAAQRDAITFGCEFEMVGIDTRTCARTINGPVDCREATYGHAVTTHWRTVTDGSIGYGGAELVSPILEGAAGIASMRAALTALNGSAARIDRRCGFHVHLGGAWTHNRGNVVRFVKAYHYFQRVLDTLQPASRRDNQNTYCANVPNVMDLPETSDGYGLLVGRMGSRYLKVNVQSMARYRTVEVRHHAGTIDPEKAAQWVTLLCGMVRAAVAGRAFPTSATLESLMAYADADATAQAYYRARAAQFARPRRTRNAAAAANYAMAANG